MLPLKLLTAQTIVSTKNFQSQFATMVKDAQEKQKYYSITRSGESVGVFLPQKLWEDLLEDLEALHSPHFSAKIKQSRKQAKAGKTLSLEEAFVS